ncbi:MAG: GDP-mannose 4,6-dehydratase, partial [Planctomycetota bacterium]
MRVLITGAAGFVGPFLAEHCISEGDAVSLTTQGDSIVELQKRFPGSAVAAMDICNSDEVRTVVSQVAPHVIYHLAAVTFIPEAEKNREAALEANVGGTLKLLEAARTLKKVHFVFVSSAQIYTPADFPILETAPVAPNSFYGVTKRTAEQLAIYYSTPDFIVSIARPFNHSGPGQRADFVLPSFAKQIAEAERGIREAKIRVGNLNSVRDFLDVRDVVRAYRAMATKGPANRSSFGEIYNICSGTGRTVRSALDGFVARSKVNVNVEVDPELLRRGEANTIIGDVTKLRTQTGWTQKIS